jgi:hypothetical protein
VPDELPALGPENAARWQVQRGRCRHCHVELRNRTS